MAGPGGKEIGRVSVRVVPDTSKFRTNLLTQLKALEEKLTVNIPTHLDTAQLAEEAKRAKGIAERAAGTVNIKVDVDKPQIAKLRKTLDAIGKTLSGISARAIKTVALTALSAAAIAAAGNVVTLAGSVATLGFGLGLLPAVGLAAAAGVAAVAVGLHGFSDALKASGDPKQFAAALKGLAPSARTAARAIAGLKPALSALRLNVQQQLFARLGDRISRLGQTIIPILNRGLTGIAQEANGAARAVIAFFRTPSVGVDLSTVLERTRQAFAHLVPAVTPLLGALRDIGTVGAGFLPRLAAGLAGVTERIAGAVARLRASGALAGLFNSAILAAQDLGRIVLGVLQILGSITSAAQAAGGTVLHDVAGAVQGLARIVASGPVQSTLETVFLGVSKALDNLKPAIKPVTRALQALAPVFSALTQAAGAVLAQALIVVANALIAMAPALQVVAEFLGRHAKLIGTLLPVVLALGLAFKTASGAVKIFQAVTAGAQAAKFLANPYVLAAVAVAALVIGIVLLFKKSEKFRGAVLAVANALKTAFAASIIGVKAAIGGLVTAYNAVVGALKTTGKAISSAFHATWDALSGVVSAAGQGITIAAKATFGALSAAVSAVGTAISATGRAISTAAKATFGALSAAASAVGKVIATVGRIIAVTFVGIAKVIATILGPPVGIVVALIVGLAKVVGAILIGLGKIVLAILVPVAEFIGGAFLAAFRSGLRGAQAALSALLAVLRPVAAFISKVFVAAFNAGLAAGRAFGNGVLAVLRPVASFISTVVVAAFNAVVSAVRALGNALLAVLRPVVAFIAQTFTVAWSALSTVVSAVGNVISIAMTTAASIALAVLRPVADFLSGVFRAAVAATGVAFQAAGTVIGTVAHGIASFIGFIVDSFKTASASATALKQSIAGAFNSAKDTITGAFNAAATAVKTAITNILTFVKGIPQSILDALGDLGSLLVQAGKDIIDGLVRGIESAFGKVKGALGKLTNLIPVSKGPPARDRKLLTPVGQMIIGGLITGLESRYDAVRASLQDFTASLAPALDVSGSLAGISGSVAVSHTVGLTPEDRALLLAQSRRQVVLETDGRPIAKLVGARAVRDRVRG